MAASWYKISSSVATAAGQAKHEMAMAAGKPANPFELLSLFYSEHDLPCQLESVDASKVPADYAVLLNHEEHMTVTVESFHKSLVDVQVLEVRASEEHYSRKILLTRKSDGQVVQFGVVRLNRRLIPDRALAEIESQRTPLGRVLIDQDVMRSVKLDKLWRILPNSELKQIFRSDKTTYGRSARIRVNAESAVELLEIVAPIDH